jgi:4-hydroxybenzoate polyprenyltransferase
MVTAAVTLIVGILIFNQVENALPETTGGINSTPVTSTIESAFQLAPVVLIVLVAALVLAQVAGFRN